MPDVTLTRSELVQLVNDGITARVAGAQPADCPFSSLSADEVERVKAAAWMRGFVAGGLNGQYPAAEEAAMTAAVPELDPAPIGEDRQWSGVLLVEGVGTGDYRRISAGAVGWMNDPGTLHAMFDGGSGFGGHEDQVPVGVLRGIAREGDRLTFFGSWASDEEALKAQQMNIDGTLRGVSADLDAVTWHLEDGDGNVIEGDELFDLPLDAEVWQVIDSARVRGATLWSIPAFVEAYVLDASVADQVPDTSWASAPADTSPLAIAASAALVASPMVNDAAPSSWFANPGLTERTPITITDEGRVFGHIANWGTCHVGFGDGQCVTPPDSTDDYSYFAAGEYHTRDGKVIPVGQITMDTGHAPLDLNAWATMAHYDDTGTAVIDIAVGNDDLGIWMAGAIRPDVPKAKVEALRRAGKVSGDWRKIGGGLKMVAALACNVPGFPIPRVASRVASGAQTALVASGIVATSPASQPRDFAGIGEAVAKAIRAGERRRARAEESNRRLRAQRARRTVARTDALVNRGE